MSFIKVVFEATGYAYLFDTYSYFPIFLHFGIILLLQVGTCRSEEHTSELQSL